MLRSVLRAIGAPAACMLGFPVTWPVRPREVTASDEEFEAVYWKASLAVRLAMLLAREAGIRSGTIRRFNAGNCNFETQTITGRTKGYTSYTVPMTQRLRSQLLIACAGAKDQSEPLLVQYAYHRKTYAPSALSHGLAKAKKLAGLEKTPWTYHDLRRTGARKVYDATHDIRKVQAFLGHSAPMNSFWYLGNAALDLTAEEVETISTAERKRA